jgi:small subunit ribosomal protein S9
VTETTNTTPMTPTTPPPQPQTRSARLDAEPQTGLIITVGRRKSAVARVRLSPGTGQMRFNGKRTVDEYFPREQDRLMCMAALRLVGGAQKYDVVVNVKGGGPAGQAGAVRHGIARALVKAEPSQYPVLKAVGFLTRDAREVERKKPGRAGARRSFQFSKR